MEGKINEKRERDRPKETNLGNMKMSYLLYIYILKINITFL